ncbi:MAG: sulfatase-like hydrolase/transferase [Lentisphaerales bacterium]|nr:sulfatase-like hydrolase/transferase [Lentisphaerales bacterium]
MRNAEVIEWPTDISRLTLRYTEEAVNFIKENKSQPFFLFLAHSTPHHPYTVSKEFRGKSAHGLYGDMIEEIDWSTGQVLNTLKELGLDKNTIVIYSSDNGGDGKPNTMHPEKGSNLPLRDWKSSNYEGGSRVPGVFWWPGKIPAGKTTDEMASVLDIMPTFAQLAGVNLETPQKIDGKDIWDIISCKDRAKTPHKYLYFAGNGSITGVRTSRFKYLDKGKELYDLQNDISESKNIAENYPEIVKDLQKAINRLQKDLDTNFLEPPVNTGVKQGSGKKKKKTGRRKNKFLQRVEQVFN